MKMNTSAFHDPFLRLTKDVKCPLGLTPHDAARLQPGQSIPRTFEQIDDVEQKNYSKSEEYILAQGAAVGLADNGQCCHFWPGRVSRFVGFLMGSNENRASVKTRGSIVIKIEGTTNADRGKPVYCFGPNNLSLEKAPGAAEIGKIRYVQGNGLASVAFKRYDSDKPLNLSLKP